MLQTSSLVCLGVFASSTKTPNDELAARLAQTATELTRKRAADAAKRAAVAAKRAAVAADKAEIWRLFYEGKRNKTIVETYQP